MKLVPRTELPSQTSKAEVMSAFPLFDYDPHEMQQIMHRLTQLFRFVTVVAGRRGGKTRGAAAAIAEITRNLVIDKLTGQGRWLNNPHPPFQTFGLKEPVPFLHIAIVAPTYALLSEPKKALGRVLRPTSMGGSIVTQGPHTWWLKYGVRLSFLSADNPERLVSYAFDHVWIDEMARIKMRAWTDNLLPALADTGGGALFTTTPIGRNDFYPIWAKGSRKAAESLLTGDQTVEDILDPSYASLSWHTAQNTKIPGLAAQVELLRKSMPYALWRRNFKADFDAFEGQVFQLPQTIFTPHQWHDTPSQLSGGFDFGFSHKSAFSLLRYNDVYHPTKIEEVESFGQTELTPVDSQAWHNRYRKPPSTLATHAHAILKRHAGDRWSAIPVYVPHDRPDISEQLRQRGFNVQRSNQKPQEDLGFLQTVVKSEVLRITSAALKAEITGLQYPDTTREPTKPWRDEKDDIFDAFRAAATPLIQNAVQPQVAGAPVGWAAR